MIKKIKQFLPANLVLLLLVCGCAKHLPKDKMTLHQLSQEAEKNITAEKHDKAQSYLEEIVSRFADNNDIAKHKMALSETYFKQGNYAAAQVMYDHYQQFYPADKQAEYAKYKSVLSMFYQTLKPDCDQTATHKTIQLCDEYQQNKHFSAFTKDIDEIKSSCQEKIIDKEFYVANFYLKRENYDAVRNRLKNLRTKYLPDMPALEPRLLYLECLLARQEHDTKTGEQSIKTLLAKYPSSPFTQIVQAQSTKKSFMF